MYIISRRGRKSGVARATGATASLAPMYIYLYLLQGGTNPISMLGVNTHFLNLAITLVLQISSEIADILRFN